MRRGTALLAVAALFALGGCLGGASGPGGPADTPDATTTPASTTTTTTTIPATTSPGATDSGTATPAATARPETTAGPAVVAYGSLSEQAQRVFRWGLENGTVSGLRGLDAEAMRPLFESRPVYVRYEGERYAVTAQRDSVPRDVLVGVRAANVTDAERLLVYANLSERGREAFDAVRTGEETSVSLPHEYDGLPGTFQKPGVVVYEGTAYRVKYARGHVYEYTVRVASD